MDSSDRLFLDYSARKLRQYAGRIEDCLGRLNEEQIWARGAESENAVGNLVLHLAGNVRQWIVAAVGGRPDIRQRDAEFAARGGVAGIRPGGTVARNRGRSGRRDRGVGAGPSDASGSSCRNMM